MPIFANNSLSITLTLLQTGPTRLLGVAQRISARRPTSTLRSNQRIFRLPRSLAPHVERQAYLCRTSRTTHCPCICLSFKCARFPCDRKSFRLGFSMLQLALSQHTIRRRGGHLAPSVAHPRRPLPAALTLAYRYKRRQQSPASPHRDRRRQARSLEAAGEAACGCSRP